MLQKLPKAVETLTNPCSQQFLMVLKKKKRPFFLCGRGIRAEAFLQMQQHLLRVAPKTISPVSDPLWGWVRV